MFSNKNAQQSESRQPSKFRRRAVTVAFVGAAVAGGVFAAQAFMTTSSPVNTPGHTGTVVSPTLTGSVVGDLYQGNCNPVQVTISNPNPVGVTIASIDKHGFVTSPGDPRPAVSRVENMLQQMDVTSANGTQIAAGETKTITLPNAVCFLNDSKYNDNQYQNQAFTPSYVVNFTQIPGTEAGSVNNWH